MKLKKITETQMKLLKMIIKVIKKDKKLLKFKFNQMKGLCDLKSFDTSFNSLVFKGHILTDDYLIYRLHLNYQFEIQTNSDY